jgi:ATP-dependent helicase/nuclease subunit B
MNSFLEEIATNIHKQSKGKPEESVIIVPSHRIGRKLQLALSSFQEKAQWSPEITTLPDFVEKNTGLRISPRIHLLPILYEAYQKTGFRPLAFDEFIPLGESLLTDFDDVLLSMADNKVLFEDLRNIKEIEDWSYQLGELTESQDRFLHLWKCMGSTFESYIELQKTRSVYSYSLLIRELSNRDFPTDPSRHFVFIAGNTIHKAEKQLLKKLKSISELKIFCDRDDYYSESSSHEAGSFIRKILHELPSENTNSNFWNNPNKKIFIRKSQTLIGCSIKASILLDLNEKKTGLVVANKEMLLPVIEHLPSTIADQINIAGGYPIHITPVFRLIQGIIDLHSPIEADKSTTARWYYKDIIQLARNPCVDKSEMNGLEKYLIDQHLVYLDTSDFIDLQNQFPGLDVISPFFLQEIMEGKTMISLLNHLLRIIEKNSKDVSTIAIVVEAAMLIEKCEDFLNRYEFASSINCFNYIWKRLSFEHQLTYSNTVGKRVEILSLKDSLFEDFDRIIFVGANEGELPQTSGSHSLIPRDVRRVFGMTVPEDEEERQAYLFYRLLQRPTEIHLFYSSLPKSFGNAEKSRYITQLQFESTVNIHTVHDQFDSDFRSISKFFAQDENSRKSIISRAEDGLSASAIATYFNCPLDYYYKYIIGLGEAPIMEETIHPSTFGTIAHAVLENFYKPHIGSFPSAKDYDAALANLEAIVREKFNEHYSIKQSHTGKNYISIQVLTETLSRFLKAEKTDLEYYKGRTIYDIERKVKIPLSIEVNGQNFDVHLKGTIDRIDLTPEGYEIIDFKTGRVEEKDLTISSIEKAFAPKKGKIIQVLMYLYMAQKDLNVDSTLIRACLISLQKYKQGRVYGKFGDRLVLCQEDLIVFEKSIEQLINELLSERNFEHHSTNRYCEYCIV